ncbi:MAG: hypothetical protein US96_C0023G0002 [Candidatus Woesebacteria bacterium GW2011_GWB1_38_5b]|uniref:ATP synthase F1 complex delta/epsilon subunit N-terminal domain-containing protein n=1 Tax=Candidatus Woesebacteria bacterium GW2011_GWB1_38_5b TaxID=1618569 RepID=A0A0G0K564_9BACT|nr:MAG: hypothetical protein US96_C0023G0002 [Candidatus Woesebacteria bacterium GW2011_GWB1_38_5b]
MSNIPFTLFVRNKKGVLINSQAKSITSYNRLGRFDILSTHSQYISVIEGSLLVTYEDNKTDEIPLSQGILKVLENRVSVYLTDK